MSLERCPDCSDATVNAPPEQHSFHCIAGNGPTCAGCFSCKCGRGDCTNRCCCEPKVLKLVEGFEYPFITEFIKEHGDHRITKEAQAYYAKPDGEGIVVWLSSPTEILALSASKVGSGGTEFSITVTHKQYRNRGLGSCVLREKLEHLGTKYTAIVAEDNGPSKRICEKVGLFKVKSLTRTRKSGKYKAILFESKWKSVEEPIKTSLLKILVSPMITILQGLL